MSTLLTSHLQALRDFLADGRFARSGALLTDLDGTAVIEREGRIFLPPEVEIGLKRIRDVGRPVIANTLRFPLSVMRVFGDEWNRVTGTALPLVSLRGSQIGRVVRSRSGDVDFEEWHAVPLQGDEIDEVLDGVEGMVDDGVRDLLVFHYPRDWRRGELIWTPDATRIDALREKYRSASAVSSSSVRELRERLHAQPHCMLFLLIELPEDRLMAYQHTSRANFIVHRGISKRAGAEWIAAHLGFDLAASIGAGDTQPDDFLAAVGFAVIVGAHGVDHQGLTHTARVESVAELGLLLAVVDERLER